MQIADHKLAEHPFRKAHAFGGDLASPTLIVLHDTAGRLTKGNSVDWFCSTDCGASAHVVIERDGSITQVVPFNKIAFHAGKSTYKGKSVRGSCNSFSIGIEIVNPGKLDKDGKAWFHKAAEKGFPDAQKRATREHGAGWWLDYTPEQIEAVEALCGALVKEYPSLAEITAHWVISPGRKIDTNPLFPLDAVRSAVFDAPSEATTPTPIGDAPTGSRIVATSNAGQTLSAAGAVGGIGLGLADALGYGGQILPLVKTYGLPAFILVMLVLAAGFAIVKHFRVEDHVEGKTKA